MNDIQAPSKPVPFPSLVALRVEHLKLLKRLDVAEDKESTLSDSLLAEIQDLLGRVKATGVKLSLATDRGDAQSVLTYWISVLRNKGVTTKTTLLARFDQAEAIRGLAGKSPYKGLTAFQQEDADLFFGRRELVADMLRVLPIRRLLTVLGISGSGKSSIVRAGVLPALRDDAIPGSKDWLYIPTFVPGPDPLTTLGNVLRPPDMGPGSSTETMAIFRNDPNTLLRLLDLRAKPTLLVIDQFEEVFTLSLAEADRDALFANLAALLKTPGCRHSVILTVRSEFDSQLSQTALGEFMADSRVRVPTLQPTELRDAIERPAERFGVRLDPAVVQSLIKNVLNEPAGLPLLEFALMKLWQKQENQLISNDAYVALGGTPQQILVKAADDSLESFNLPEDQERCKLLFLRLVRTGDSLEVTSRRRRLEEFKSIGIEHVERLLATFERDGLLRVTPADPREKSTVEVSHESLTRNWPTLVKWVRDDLSALRSRELLEETAAQWKKSPQAVTLYSGGQLKGALEFPDLSKDESKFLEESKRVNQRERAGVITFLVLLLLLAGGFLYSLSHKNRVLRDANEQVSKAEREAVKAQAELTESNRQLQQTIDAFNLVNLKRTMAETAQQSPQLDKMILYIQIPDDKDRELARKISVALKKLNDKLILPGIQRLDPNKVNFPKKTQLRYFRAENLDLASYMVANALSPLDDVRPTLIGAEAVGVDRLKALPPFLFELWIGTDAASAKAPSKP